MPSAFAQKRRTGVEVGLIEDAAPLFAHADSLPRAGPLLAVPPLVASSVLSVARKIYGTIGPAFYGLRTTLVIYILLSLLRIPRPEILKEYAPNDLGRIVGLDRFPRSRRCAANWRAWHPAKPANNSAANSLSGVLRNEAACSASSTSTGMFAYHGKHTISKGYLTRTRMAARQRPITG